MSSIERYDVNEQWAHSGLVKAGDFCYLSYCVGNIGAPWRSRSTARSTTWKGGSAW